MRIFKRISVSWQDFPDDESLAVVVYFSGCSHNCEGCQNKNSQEYFSEETVEVSPDELFDLIEKECKKHRTDKVVLSGGDPLFYKNIKDVSSVLKKLNTLYEVCIYTGHDISYVIENDIKCKYIKSGKYEINKKVNPEKTNDYMQFASINQELYSGFDYTQLSKNGKFLFNGE